MTYAARQVLADCEAALSMLEADQDEVGWRVHWAAAVALVRAVGHVLHNVDGKTCPAAKAAIAEAFANWKADRDKHAIFHEFVEKERNNLLKQYHSDVHPLSEAMLAVDISLVSLRDGKPFSLKDVFELDENIYRPMLDGYYVGDDARDVLSNAISWWKVELNAIDEKTASTKRSST